MRRPHGLAITAGAVAMVLATPAAASAAGIDKMLFLRQGTPVTAAGFEHGSCPGVSRDRDGWHFVIPKRPRGVEFESLTVTFDPGGSQTIRSFAGDHDAYVSSPRGARLTGATAWVDAGIISLITVIYFDLVNTCPGRAPSRVAKPAKPGSQPVKPSKSPTPSASPSATPSPTETVPLLKDAVEQPELEVSGADSSPVAAIGSPDDIVEPANGIGIQGFAIGVLGGFLLLFGGVTGFLTWRKRRA